MPFFYEKGKVILLLVALTFSARFLHTQAYFKGEICTKIKMLIPPCVGSWCAIWRPSKFTNLKKSFDFDQSTRNAHGPDLKNNTILDESDYSQQNVTNI